MILICNTGDICLCWRTLPPPRIGGHQASETLCHDPSRLPAAKSDMGDYTLVLAGMEFNEGPGFVLLAGKGPAGELLLDPACVIAAAT